MSQFFLSPLITLEQLGPEKFEHKNNSVFNLFHVAIFFFSATTFSKHLDYHRRCQLHHQQNYYYSLCFSFSFFFSTTPFAGIFSLHLPSFSLLLALGYSQLIQIIFFLFYLFTWSILTIKKCSSLTLTFHSEFDLIVLVVYPRTGFFSKVVNADKSKQK